MGRNDFEMDDLVRAIWSHKLAICFTFALTVGLVGLATLLAPKQYRSEAKLFARLGRENVGLDATATLGEGSTVAIPMTRETEINSIAEAIMSRQLLENVVDNVGPSRILNSSNDTASEGTSADGFAWLEGAFEKLRSAGVLTDISHRERAVLRLEKKLNVEAVERTTIVLISFEAREPEVARDVVQSVVVHYIEQHRDLHRATGALDFLTEQSRIVGEGLAKSEQLLAELKSESGLISIEDARRVHVERAGRVRDELMQAKAKQAALQSEVRHLAEQLANLSPTRVVQATTGAGNEGIDGMRQQLFSLEMEREQLTTRHTQSHPAVRQIEEQLRRVTDRMRGEEAVRTEKTIGPNTVYTGTKTQLVQQKALLSAQDALVATLESQDDAMRRDIRRFADLELEHNRLSRRVAMDDADFRKFAQNLTQAELDDALARESISNIGLAQTATLNHKPCFPNKLLNLVLGIGFGCFNSVAVAVMLDRRRPSKQRTSRAAAVPLPVANAAISDDVDNGDQGSTIHGHGKPMANTPARTYVIGRTTGGAP